MVKSVHLVAQIWDSSGTSSGSHRNLIEDFENESAMLRLHTSLADWGNIHIYRRDPGEPSKKWKWRKTWELAEMLIVFLNLHMDQRRVEALQAQGNWEQTLPKSLPDY